MLSSQLAEALGLKNKHEKSVKELSEERDQLLKENTLMKVRHKTDKREAAALKSENTELNEQMAARLENIRKLISRNE